MLEGRDDYIEHAETILSDEKDRLAEYTQVVERLSELLDHDLAFERYHPLQNELSNLAPTSVKSLATLVRMIECFEDDPTFQADILPRLKRPQQYLPARLELEIAYFVKDAGKSVEFVDPKVTPGEQQQDLLIEGFLPMEIKQLQQPDHISEQMRYFQEISTVLMRAGAPSSFRRAGTIHRPLAEPEKDKFIEEIEAALPAVEDGEVKEIRSTSLCDVDYEMLLAPHDREDELEAWQEEHDVDGPLSGPAQSKNDILRLKREIQEKVEQLPEDTPGVVLIELDPWLTSETRSESLLGIVKGVLKDVYDHEQLTSLVLLVRGRYLDMDPIDQSIENVRIADFEPLGEFGLRTFVAVHNKFVDDPEGKELVDSIFSNP